MKGIGSGVLWSVLIGSVYEYSDSYSYSESYPSSDSSSTGSWESENERVVKIPPHIERVDSSEESEDW